MHLLAFAKQAKNVYIRDHCKKKITTEVGLYNVDLSINLRPRNAERQKKKEIKGGEIEALI